MIIDGPKKEGRERKQATSNRRGNNSREIEKRGGERLLEKNFPPLFSPPLSLSNRFPSENRAAIVRG